MVESAINKYRHLNIASLGVAVEAALTELDRDGLKWVCDRFNRDLRPPFKKNRRYIELDDLVKYLVTIFFFDLRLTSKKIVHLYGFWHRNLYIFAWNIVY